MKPVLSINDLAFRLGIKAERLKNIACNIDDYYTEFRKVVKAGREARHFRVPKRELRFVQGRIISTLLAPMMGEAGAAHGGIKGRSPATNAAAHLGQACVVSMDIRSYFNQVRPNRVYRMFIDEYGFGRDVASILTKLTTWQGLLPQGAPTSPVLANLLLVKRVDEPLEAKASSEQIRYTRFVDDLTFSGNNPRKMINHAARLLSRLGLPVHRHKPFAERSKLKITSRSRDPMVTGLSVQGTKRLSVPMHARELIRKAIAALGDDPVVSPKELLSIEGRLVHVERFNPGHAMRLRRRFNAKLVQLRQAYPSLAEVKRTRYLFRRLRVDLAQPSCKSPALAFVGAQQARRDQQ